MRSNGIVVYMAITKGDGRGYTLRIIMLGVVFLGAFWWLPVAITSKSMHPALRVVAFIIGALGLIAMFDKDAYLPFLAETVMPHNVLQAPQNAEMIKPNPEDIVVTLVDLPVNTRVLYWAAENGDPRTRDLQIPTWKEAYGAFTNCGVVETNREGHARIVLKCPQRYSVNRFGFKTVLPPHLHYRYALPSKKGLMSRVYTHYFKCGHNS